MPDLTKLSRRTFILSSIALAAACKPGTAALEITGKTMGTTYNVVALDTICAQPSTAPWPK